MWRSDGPGENRKLLMWECSKCKGTWQFPLGGNCLGCREACYAGVSGLRPREVATFWRVFPVSAARALPGSPGVLRLRVDSSSRVQEGNVHQSLEVFSLFLSTSELKRYL